MKKTLLVCFAVLAFTLQAAGQAYTAVTATNVLVDSGGSAVHPPSGSDLCALGTNGATQAVTYTPAGGSPVTGTVCQTLNGSGALTGSLQWANGAAATPAPLFYTITVSNGATVYLTLPLVQVQGAVFSFDNYRVTATSSSSGIGMPHIACTPGAKFTSTTLSPSGYTCNLINGVGAWVTYPAANYCGNGQALVVGQGTGQNFCISPEISGLGSPTGSCVERATYFQLDSAPGAFLWGCVNTTWVQAAGGGGGSGLTSFQGRTTPAATLQVSDLTGLLANAPFGFSGSHGIVTDTGSGTMAPNDNWSISTGGALAGAGDFSILTSPSGSTVFSVNHATGAFSAAAGSFNVAADGATRWGGGAAISSTDVLCLSDGTHCPGASTLYYQTVQLSNSSLTSRPRLNILGATGISAADNPTNTSTDISLLQASASQFGAVKVDGTSISASGGVISAIGAPPTGACLGDLSGTFPNCTVAKVDGVAYPASPTTDTVPVVTGSNAVTYEKVPSAAIATVNTGPGTCGDATHVCQITTNAGGQTSSQSQVPIGSSGAVVPNQGINPVASIYFGDSNSTTFYTSQTWVNRLAALLTPGAFTNYAVSGDQACDETAHMFNDDAVSPIAQQPLRAAMIGTNDANHAGAGPYQATFNACYQAGLSWETIPSNFKVLASTGSTTGTCSNDTTYAAATGKSCTAVASTITLSLATPSGVLYIWPRSIDGNTGVWTYAIDGGTAVSVNTALTTPIATQNGLTTAPVQIRVAGLTAGSHSVVFTQTNAGTMPIIGIGTPPTGLQTTFPYLLMGGIINQQNGGNQANVDAYRVNVNANVAQAKADGLNVYYAPVEDYVAMTTTAGDSANSLHMNAAGQGEAANAFLSAIKMVPGSPTTANNAPTILHGAVTYTLLPTDVIVYAQAGTTINYPTSGSNPVGYKYTVCDYDQPITGGSVTLIGGSGGGAGNHITVLPTTCSTTTLISGNNWAMESTSLNINGVIPVTELGTGTAASRTYVDGGTGAFTPLGGTPKVMAVVTYTILAGDSQLYFQSGSTITYPASGAVPDGTVLNLCNYSSSGTAAITGGSGGASGNSFTLPFGMCSTVSLISGVNWILEGLPSINPTLGKNNYAPTNVAPTIYFGGGSHALLATDYSVYVDAGSTLTYPASPVVPVGWVYRMCNFSTSGAAATISGGSGGAPGNSFSLTVGQCAMTQLISGNNWSLLSLYANGVTNLTGAANSGWYNSGANTTAAIASANNAVIATNGSGVPSAVTTLPSGLTIPSPTFSGTVAGGNTVPLGVLAQTAANTMLGNWTGSTANVTANSMPSCSTASSALKYTSGTGIGCNTAIDATTLAGNSVVAIANGGTAANSAAAGTMPNATSSSAASWTATPTLGVAGSVLGSLTLASTTATGSVKLQPASAASAFTMTIPASSSTLACLACVETFTAGQTISGNNVSNFNNPMLTLSNSTTGAREATMNFVTPGRNWNVGAEASTGCSGNLGCGSWWITVAGSTNPSFLIAGPDGNSVNLYPASNATSGSGNLIGPAAKLHSFYWDGAASADDLWSMTNTLGSGSSPTSTLTYAHSGSPGTALVAFPGITTTSLTVNGGTPMGSNQGTGTSVQHSTGSTATNDCVKFDSTGNTVDSGAVCPVILKATSTSITSPAPGVCTTATASIPGLTSSMAIAISASSDPGGGQTYVAYYNSSGSAIIQICATASSTSNTVTYNLAAF